MINPSQLYSFLIAILISQISLAQVKDNSTCDTPSDALLDLNSITKCTVEKVSNTKASGDVKIQVTARRRVVRKKQANTVLHDPHQQELANIKSNNSLIANLDLKKENIIEKVPFSVVEQGPLFKKCERVSLKEQKKCFNEHIMQHISSHLVYPKKSYEEGIQGRVLMQFVVDTDGSITNINTRGPYLGEELVEEAKRIIKELPHFIPGKHLGKTVKVKYGVPITFNIPGVAPTNKRPVKATNVFGEVYNFNELDAIPYFDNCITKDVDCFNNNLIKHINTNFYYPEEALENNIEGKVIVYFTVDKHGDILDIKTRGPKNGAPLEKATTALFNKLPRIKPGILKGKNVNSKYIFPIDFKLN